MKKILSETDPANAEEKIINRFFANILNSKEEKLLELDGTNKTVVTLESIIDAWSTFKKEWYENKNE